MNQDTQNYYTALFVNFTLHCKCRVENYAQNGPYTFIINQETSHFYYQSRDSKLLHCPFQYCYTELQNVVLKTMHKMKPTHTQKQFRHKVLVTLLAFDTLLWCPAVVPSHDLCVSCRLVCESIMM